MAWLTYEERQLSAIKDILQLLIEIKEELRQQNPMMPLAPTPPTKPHRIKR